MNDIMSLSMSDFSKYITYAGRKIPMVPLSINFLIAEFAFDSCPHDSKTIFWSYFPLLCLMTIAWEAIASYAHFTTVYPRKPRNEHIIFTVLSTFMSAILFISLTYFLKNGRPISCVTPYDQTTAVVLFSMSVLISAFITYCEHFKWGKLVPQGAIFDL